MSHSLLEVCKTKSWSHAALSQWQPLEVPQKCIDPNHLTSSLNKWSGSWSSCEHLACIWSILKYLFLHALFIPWVWDERFLFYWLLHISILRCVKLLSAMLILNNCASYTSWFQMTRWKCTSPYLQLSICNPTASTKNLGFSGPLQRTLSSSSSREKQVCLFVVVWLLSLTSFLSLCMVTGQEHLQENFTSALFLIITLVLSWVSAQDCSQIYW